MYNLEPQKDPITGEDIEILVIDRETNLAVIPLKEDGTPFPAGQVDPVTGVLTVTAPDYAFRLPPKGGALPRQVVNIQFIRTNPRRRIKETTNTLVRVVVEDDPLNDPDSMQKLNLVVPRPPDVPTCTYYVAPRGCGCFGLFRRRR
jgi:hypothetical protein